MDTFRGHEIRKESGIWLFSDTGDPVASTWKSRPCGYCGSVNTQEGHDGCIRRLPSGVINACCGHGELRLAYVQFATRVTLRGSMARGCGYQPPDSVLTLAEFDMPTTEDTISNGRITAVAEAQPVAEEKP